ncbi:uncharacterized protein LOC125073409 [Vanessa atalanta]|uniref:uncharacterized protein LOC125073409 n=1 Tax=Vanessa atalanta TaxID=42275 RepID=UPI001FCE25BD|nr:uncharacterized protein LOC125073409 [Vanessa atalanta]
MSAEKLSSDEVPEKFTNWLLAMGCPAEKVPSIERITQMCRGQYYMVWRSLMEHVEAKNIIRQKRLQVFCDDVKICKEKNVFKECSPSAVVPEQLVVWKNQQELREKVADAEARVEQARNNLNQLINKISCKLSQRNTSRRRIEDLQRRTWLLRQVSNELNIKKANLEETRSIAKSLFDVNNDQDVESKLEKYINSTTPTQTYHTLPLSNPIASSSIVSTNENETAIEKEDNMLSLVTCRGDVLWPLLYEKRSAIVAEMSLVNAKHTTDVDNNRTTPQSVLAHTAALHANLALEVMKNKVYVKQTHDRFVAAVEELNNYITGEACELLVLRCERARSEARVKSMKTLLEELSTKSGVFRVEGDEVDDNQTTAKKIADIDKSIINTRDELKRLILSLATTERKINSIKECLVAVFQAFHNNTNIEDSERFRGVQLDFPQESISMIRQFYTERLERNRNNGNLSLDFDVSDTSFNEMSDSNPRFVDELRVYLKKFNLEKNRKLVLDSGDKIWIFETLETLASRLNSRWLSDDLTPLLCPSVRVSSAVQSLVHSVQEKTVLTNIVKAVNEKSTRKIDIDISSKVRNEEQVTDKIKKSISENLILLKKICKTFDLSQENLQFWSNDEIKKFMSTNRTVDGKTYKDYEGFYLENIKLKS